MCSSDLNEMKNQFPPNLETLTKTTDLAPAVLRPPGNSATPMTYVYLRPTAGVAAPPDQVVVYEQSDAPQPRLNVGFANGHVELVDQARFQKLLAASKARNGKQTPDN